MHYAVSREQNLTWFMPLYSVKREKKDKAGVCVCIPNLLQGAFPLQLSSHRSSGKYGTRRLRAEQLSSVENQQCVTAKTENKFKGWANLLIGPNDADKSQKAQHVKPDFPS